MKTCGLQWSDPDIHNFFEYSGKENYIATICAEKDAEFVADGEKPLYFRFDLYSDADIERILGQAEQWQISCIEIENGDPSYGYPVEPVKSEHIQKIDIGRLLVQEGNFAGVIDYSRDLGDHFDLCCALISSYNDTPLRFAHRARYGSSDCEVMYIYDYYLQKA